MGFTLQEEYACREKSAPPSKNRVGGKFGAYQESVDKNRLPAQYPCRRNCFTATKCMSGRTLWLSRDPIAEDGGINLYGYVENNPINLWDPDGLKPFGTPGGTTVPEDTLKEIYGYSDEEWEESDKDQKEMIKECGETITDYLIKFPLTLFRRLPDVTKYFPLRDYTKPIKPDQKPSPTKPLPKVPNKYNPDMHPNKRPRVP